MTRERREDHECRWTNTTMECAICGREWIAMHCRCPAALECPNCGHMNDLGATPEETTDHE